MPHDTKVVPVTGGDAVAYWWGGPSSFDVGIGTDGDDGNHKIVPEQLFDLRSDAKGPKRGASAGRLRAAPAPSDPISVACERLLKFRGSRHEEAPLPPSLNIRQKVTATERSFRGLIYRRVSIKTQVRNVLAGGQWKRQGVLTLYSPVGFDEKHADFRAWKNAIQSNAGR